MWASLISAAVMIVLSFPLTALFGIWGISTAVLLSVFASAAYFLLFYTKRLNVKLSQLFPWKELFLQLLISLLSAAIIRFTIYPLLTSETSLSVLKAGFYLLVFFICDMLVYVVLLFITKNSIFLEYKNKITRIMATSKS
jgi:hypothetical protein